MKQSSGNGSTDPERISKGLTVPQAKTIATVLSKGGTIEEAAEEVGLSLVELRRVGVLTASIRGLLERAEVDDRVRRRLGKARLVELAMQDNDLKVALGAAKVISGEGVPGVAIQFNQQNLVTDPEVLESIKSLGIEIEGKEDDEKTRGSN